MKLFDTIKSNKDYFIILSLIFFIYLPWIVFGNFSRDDWFLKDLHEAIGVYDSFRAQAGAFSNRPFAMVFFAITSMFSGSFIFYIILDLSILFISILLIFKCFEEFFEDNFIKITFLISLMIPIYSMTNIFSPGMQILGNVSLLIWSFSLITQKYYFDYRKNIYLIYSFLFIIIMLLTYESAFPLLSLNFFYPLFKKKHKTAIDKSLIINIFLIIFGVIIAFIIQKLLLPLFYDDISRFRVEDEGLFFILRLTLINIILQLNIFFLYFENINLAISDIFSNYFITFFFIISLILILSIIKKFSIKKITFFKDYKKNKLNIFFIITCLFLCIFLTAVMHTVAKSGVSFWGYNNRALISISVILPITISLLYSHFNKKNFIRLLIIFFLILKIIFLYAFQINHISNSQKMIKRAIDISKTLKGDKNINQIEKEADTLIILYSKKFIDLKLHERTTYINDNFTFRYLIDDINDKYYYSYFLKQYDFKLPKRSITKDMLTGLNVWSSNHYYMRGFHINDYKFCIKPLWNLYFKRYILDEKDRDIYLIIDTNNIELKKENFIKLKDHEDLFLHIEKYTDCSRWDKRENSEKVSNIELSERKLFYHDSIFLRSLIKFYYKFFQ